MGKRRPVGCQAWSSRRGWSPSGKGGGYLETLVSGLSPRVPPKIERPAQALALAVEMEKDSILFYTELAAAARNERARRNLDGIFRAEKLHLVEVRERFEDGS